MPFRLLWVRLMLIGRRKATTAQMTEKGSRTECSFDAVEWRRSIKEFQEDEQTPKVVLMGDSVLDDFFWLLEPRECLRETLQRQLNEEFPESRMTCVNLAVDQMSSFDFIARNPQENSWEQYSLARNRAPFSNPLDQSYFSADDGNIYSVENLNLLKNTQCVVLSLGGNDVYLRRDIQLDLALSLLPLSWWRRRNIAIKFGQRIEKILDAIRSTAPNALLVPVIVYHPHYSFSLSGHNGTGWLSSLSRLIQRLVLSKLVSPLAQQLLLQAQRLGLPVIDLSRTFDPANVCHYGTEHIKSSNEFHAPWSGAEPSNVSNEFIAKLILEVIKSAPANGGESRVFFGKTNRSGNVLEKVVVEKNVALYPHMYKFGGRLLPFGSMFYSDSVISLS